MRSELTLITRIHDLIRGVIRALEGTNAIAYRSRTLIPYAFSLRRIHQRSQERNGESGSISVGSISKSESGGGRESGIKGIFSSCVSCCVRIWPLVELVDELLECRKSMFGGSSMVGVVSDASESDCWTPSFASLPNGRERLNRGINVPPPGLVEVRVRVRGSSYEYHEFMSCGT